MGSVQNFFTSRDNNANAETYVGQLDRLWYNPTTNSIFVSDGSTPGGQPVALATNANIVANNITVNQVTSTTGNIAVTGNLVITGNISPATSTRVGGIIPGPGVEISNIGLLTIDSAGLPISFGDFYANVNQLSMVNANEAMYLVSNGTGNINLIGGVNFYKPNGFPPSAEPFFRAKSDGQIQILVPVEDPVEGGVEIIGSASGTYVAPGAPGAMLQLTGNPNVSCRLYQDSIGSYASFVGRRFNGNVASPTQVLASEDVFRINATAATNAGVGNVALAQISITALENQTTTAQGSKIGFTVTPVGSPANARVEVANITVANGVSATKFTTAGTITATGNITGGNISATNYTGLVTHSIREAGNVSGGTVTLNMTTDDVVRCTFANAGMTVAFSNIIPGRTVTLLAVKTDGGSDTIDTGIAAQNMSTGDETVLVDGVSTVILTYYSLGTTTANIYCSMNYRP